VLEYVYMCVLVVLRCLCKDLTAVPATKDLMCVFVHVFVCVFECVCACMRASVCLRIYGVCGCVCVLVAVNTEVISAPTIEELMGPASNIVMAIASKVSRSDHVCD